MYFAQETRDVRDLALQELVQNCHMRFLPEENVVGQILKNLTDNHEATTHCRTVLSRQLDIDIFWCNNGRCNKSEEI